METASFKPGPPKLHECQGDTMTTRLLCLPQVQYLTFYNIQTFVLPIKLILYNQKYKFKSQLFFFKPQDNGVLLAKSQLFMTESRLTTCVSRNIKSAK